MPYENIIYYIIIPLGSVLIGASIAWIREWWISEKERKRQAHYLAIRIVNVLENYIIQASQVVSLIKMPVKNIGDINSNITLKQKGFTLAIPKYPNDIDWKSIDFELIRRTLLLLNTAENTERYLAMISPDFSTANLKKQMNIIRKIEKGDVNKYYEDCNSYFAEVQSHYATLSLEAIGIMGEFCDTYKVDSKFVGDIPLMRHFGRKITKASRFTKEDYLWSSEDIHLAGNPEDDKFLKGMGDEEWDDE